MPYPSSIARLLALLLLAHVGESRAQIASDGSPYSAFGFGDLLTTGQVPSALMGGAGIAYTEPFSILSANPASYAAARYINGEGLVRPVFEGGVRGLFLKQESGSGATSRSDAQFMGLSVGIPFGKGRWGMGFGITPFSDVGYSLSETHAIDEGPVTYEYSGSGGLSRAFAGVGRVLWQEKPDSLKHLGGRLAIGGNFDFIFGSIEQTRNAVYPRGQAFTNTRAFSSLVLRSPTGSFGMHYSGAITPNDMERLYRWRLEHVDTTRLAPQDLAIWRVALTDSARIAWLRSIGWRTAYTDSASMPHTKQAKAQKRLDQWRLEHVDTTRLAYDDLILWRTARSDEARMAWLSSIGWKTAYTDSASMPRLKDIAEVRPWRFTIGLTAGLPTVFSATSNDLVTSFFRGSTGIEQTVDTLPSNGTVEGTMSIPLSYGAGLSVHNARWLITAEARRRDWGALEVDLDGYALPSALRASMMYALGARFQPDDEGGVFDRATYRAGVRYTEDYLQVKGTPLSTSSVSAGISFPLNAVQTNSYLHLGAEYGQRGTVGEGLLRETFTHLWIGVSVTPWKRERWFQRTRIQ